MGLKCHLKVLFDISYLHTPIQSAESFQNYQLCEQGALLSANTWWWQVFPAPSLRQVFYWLITKLNIIEDVHIALYCFCCVLWHILRLLKKKKRKSCDVYHKAFKSSRIPRDYEKPEKCDGSFNSSKTLISILWIFYHFKVLILHLNHIFFLFSKITSSKICFKTLKMLKKENEGRNLNWFNVVGLETPNIIIDGLWKAKMLFWFLWNKRSVIEW